MLENFAVLSEDSYIYNQDREVYNAIVAEQKRQDEHIELIASENIVSRAVLEAMGSVMTNKYAEGYPHKRYYGGCENMDTVEELAQERAKKLFDCEYVNVQPHSGAQANMAVFFGLLQPGDTVLGLSLDCGGHLSHGLKANMSGKWFNCIGYGVNSDGFIDYDQAEKLAMEHKPKLIITGFSAYSRIVDWKKFREIADKCGAFLMSDIAHVAGLIAGGYYPSPIDYADVVTTTTHKTLRGPRGGMIMAKTKELEKKLNSAVFPGIQGGPLMHVIAGKAVAFGEALRPEWKTYCKNIIDNAKTLADTIMARGVDIVSGGTDNHCMLVDLRSKGITGLALERRLQEKYNIVCNKNSVPNDPQKPTITSGVRLGTPACTTRGFGKAEFEKIGNTIVDCIDEIADESK
ncbi:MAG: serine hydroxymethyltransferase [Rickettsiales bacterium]|nr:serine hydroxymethyltransferase [Rickettsiales bacterium]